MKKLFLLFALSLIFVQLCFVSQSIAQTYYLPAGVGGGGALYSPSFNPANTNQFYVACDMTELFVTNDLGKSYSQVHFSKLQASHNSKMCFTKDTNTVYCINYANDQTVPVRSTISGKDFSPLAGFSKINDVVYSIWADYDNPERVVISMYGTIYISNDYGANFKLIYTTTNSGAGVVVGGVYFNGQSIVIGSSDGLLTSADGGSKFTMMQINGLPATEHIWSFTGVHNGSDEVFYFLTIEDKNYYAGMFDSDPSAYSVWENNAFKSATKSAYSFRPKTNTLTNLPNAFDRSKDFPMWIKSAELQTDASNLGVVYIAGGSSSSAPIIRKSTDFGVTWTDSFNSKNNSNIYTGWSGQGGDRAWSYGEVALGFTVCLTDRDKLIFTDFGYVHLSSDGGSTWHQAYTGFSTEKGITTKPKQEQKSIGIENTTAWQVVWADEQNVFACFSDIKGIRSTNAGKTWSFNYNGHNANSMYRIAKLDNGTLIGASSNIHDMYQSTRLADKILDANDSEGKLIFSTDKGANWTLIKSFSHPVFWVEVDPSNQNNAYCSVIHYNNGTGIGGVYKCNDLNKLQASTWTKLSNPPRTEGHPACLKVLKNGNLLATYSGRRNSAGSFTASSGLFLYNTQANTWTDLSDNGMKYWCKDVVVDPNDPTESTWYVCIFSGWGGAPNGLGGLYKTTNSGAKWTKIWNNDRVTSITFDPSNTNKNQIYLTTEQSGLWVCKDVSQTTPTFANVPEYNFRQPERVYFNPYQPTDMWVTSFGNGLKFKSEKAVIQTFNIISKANKNGKIFPDGTTTLNEGGEQIYEITPDVGYAIDSTEIDGLKRSTSEKFTFSKINDNHTITANFKLITSVENENKVDFELFTNSDNYLILNDNIKLEEITSLSMCDLQGKSIKILRENNKINITQLSNGIYYLNLQTGKKEFTKALIISR